MGISLERVNMRRWSGLCFFFFLCRKSLDDVLVAQQRAGRQGCKPHGECTDLITGCAAWLQALSMVPATVYLPILVEVDQIHQELIADSTYEAGWVPANTVACAWCKHGDVPAVNLATTLWGKRKCQCEHWLPSLSTMHRWWITTTFTNSQLLSTYFPTSPCATCFTYVPSPHSPLGGPPS